MSLNVVSAFQSLCVLESGQYLSECVSLEVVSVSLSLCVLESGQCFLEYASLEVVSSLAASFEVVSILLAILGTRRVHKRCLNGIINICKSRLEVHLLNTL